jgi:hypothetical protein
MAFNTFYIFFYLSKQPEVIRRDIRFTKSLQLASKIKVPFPHSLSVVVKELQGGLQLLTQGTADIILDCCDDFWSGKDLRPLKEKERKQAQDFYQKNALVGFEKLKSYNFDGIFVCSIKKAPSDEIVQRNSFLYFYKQLTAQFSPTAHFDMESRGFYPDLNHKMSCTKMK